MQCTVLRIKTSLVIMPSYRNDVGLYYFLLPSFFIKVSSWLIYFLSLTILYLKLSWQSISYEPIDCVNFHWLLDSPNTLWSRITTPSLPRAQFFNQNVLILENFQISLNCILPIYSLTKYSNTHQSFITYFLSLTAFRNKF